jgi:hypothetical protein
MQMSNATNGMTAIPVLSSTDPDFKIVIKRWKSKEDEFVYCYSIHRQRACYPSSPANYTPYPYRLGSFRGFQGRTYGTRHEALMDFAYWLVESDYTLSKLDPETTLISLSLSRNLRTAAECARRVRLNHVPHEITNPGFPPDDTEQDPNGIHQHAPGSKLDANKTKPDLVLGGFGRALNAVAQVGTYGAKKYVPGGWRVVPDGIERYSDAMMRHYLGEKAGKDTCEQKDPESNFLHAAHLAWNALARLELILQEMEG